MVQWLGCESSQSPSDANSTGPGEEPQPLFVRSELDRAIFVFFWIFIFVFEPPLLAQVSTNLEKKRQEAGRGMGKGGSESRNKRKVSKQVKGHSTSTKNRSG